MTDPILQKREESTQKVLQKDRKGRSKRKSYLGKDEHKLLRVLATLVCVKPAWMVSQFLLIISAGIGDTANQRSLRLADLAWEAAAQSRL